MRGLGKIDGDLSWWKRKDVKKEGVIVSLREDVANRLDERRTVEGSE